MSQIVNLPSRRVKIHPKLGLRISAPFLRQAGFDETKEYVIKASTPIINIVPVGYKTDHQKQSKDYNEFDEQEIKSIKQGLKELQAGKFTVIANKKELHKHFDSL